MKARLIGEKSSGMTAVEIFRAGKLVWAHIWFDDGCSKAGYEKGLCDVFDCMLDCSEVDCFEGGQIDDKGEPVVMDCGPTTGVMLEYDTDTGWSKSQDARQYGQSCELIDALMSIGILDSDDEHDDDNNIATLYNHISARMCERQK